MNPLFLLMGLFGAMFAMSGGSTASTTSEALTEPANDMPEPMDSTIDNTTEDPVDHAMDSEDHAGHDMGDMDGDSAFLDITAFGMHHGTSSHTHEDALEGGRTPITTEAMVAYNGLRAFLGLDAVDLETVGTWAFEEGLTNNDQPYGDDLPGVGLWYSMQGAKAGWIADDAFDPQIMADIQRTARLGDEADVMEMVATFGLDGFADYLEAEGLTESFINTLKMEPHYGGWMHGRTHGWLEFEANDGLSAIAHDLNHLTVLSHDQTQPFMNDTFDWPQWPALDMDPADVANYFQSMVTLGDPQGEGIEMSDVATAVPMSDPILIALSTGYLDETMPVEEEDDVPMAEML
ncbi:MAG: hypothetical protein AAGM21_15315 [Pseudomonadota bacterium]